MLLGAVVGGLTVSHILDDRERNPGNSPTRAKQHDDSDSDAAPQKPPALVRVATAERRPVQPLKPIIGRLVEVRKVSVSSEVEGQVVDMPVEEGTPVVGSETVLARVDDVWIRLALERGRSEVASIQSRLTYESLDLTRLEQLAETNTISASELDAKRASVKTLEADLATAQATVKEEDERLARLVIRAPIDGTIIAKHAELGERLSPGSPVVDIVSRGTIDARIMVPESLVDIVSIGQLVPVQIDALDEALLGTVVSITPYDVSALRAFPVRVRLDDHVGRLKVGMSVTVMVATAPEKPALVLPRDAVLVRPDGSTVWVAVPNETSQAIEVRPVLVIVRTRMKREYAVEPETLTGRALLTPGVQVIIEGAEHLVPGQNVRIVTLEDSVVGDAPQDVGPGISNSSDPDADGGTSERER